MASNLGAIEDLGDQKAKIEQYKQSLLAIIERKDSLEIMAFIDHSESMINVDMLHVLLACHPMSCSVTTALRKYNITNIF